MRPPHLLSGPRGARAVVAALVLSIAALASCSGGSDQPTITGSPAPTTTLPRFTVTGADFYTPPNPLPSGEHGDLIWAQQIDAWWGSPRRAWRVLYHSTALDGHPIAVSGFVIAPPADTTSRRPVVAWAHETIGSGDRCAPSRTFADTARTDTPGKVVSDQLSAFVDAGNVVVATDYEGLGTPGPHPFLVGQSEGRGVLDAVRAAMQLPGSGAGDDVVVYGVSQGGQAALWAGQLAASWTPELHVSGVVAAAPFSEVDLLLPAAAFVPGGEGYLAMGVYGQVAANHALSVEDVLDPAAIAQANVIEERCGEDVHLAFRAVAVSSGHSIAKLDGFASDAWKAQLASIKPAMARIGAPTFVVQGDRDVTVPARTTRSLVERLCANGDVVHAGNYPRAGHADVVVAADSDVRAWISERLRGDPAPSDCAPAR
jgi:pimeloyl-ACP methyl ester carboxylesterase